VSISEQPLTIENVVGSTEVDQELDLEAVAADLDKAEYDREKFPGAVYRSQDQASVMLIFQSGSIICTGAKSTDDVHQSLNTVFDELRELGVDIQGQPEVNIENIVSSGDLGYSLNLNATAIGLGLENAEYEPEQFPGLVYRLDDPEVAALLFGSGKVVISGATKPADAERALGAIAERLDDLNLLE